MDNGRPCANVSMLIAASPGEIFRAFVEPRELTKFWLARASGPLRVGEPVTWDFMVPGAHDTAVATALEPDTLIAWDWLESKVRVAMQAVGDGAAVTITNSDFAGDHAAQVAAALNATEGFTIVLCDLKTLLEGGASAGLTKAKAELIVRERDKP